MDLHDKMYSKTYNKTRYSADKRCSKIQAFHSNHKTHDEDSLTSFIYNMLTIDLFAQNEVISIFQKSDVYNYHVIENKPLFGNASTKEASEKAYKEFIQNQIDSLDLNQGNKTFVSLEIAKDGSIHNRKVLVGENENFN